jgi:hypothetical protein
VDGIFAPGHTRWTGKNRVYARQLERVWKGKPDICFDIAYKTPDGNKLWEKVGLASEGISAKLAADIRAERLRSIRYGEDLPKRKKSVPMFGEIAQKYLQWAEGNKCRRGADDRSRYENHLRSRFENKRLDEITPFALEKLKSDLTKRGLSPFFKWIKQHLRIQAFYGTSPNAVKTQVWAGLCIYLLVAITKKQLNVSVSLYTFLQIIEVNLFEKKSILQLLADALKQDSEPPNCNQLRLFD